eukprot:10278211-Lingulodinium_polyedra.AAC.1
MREARAPLRPTLAARAQFPQPFAPDTPIEVRFAAATEDWQATCRRIAPALRSFPLDLKWATARPMDS